MSYILSNDKTSIAYRTPVKHISVVEQFFDWCTAQDAEHRFAWTGICLLATAAVLFPLTMTFILFNGAAFSLMIPAMVALVLVVVLNLAAMPTRYTIPAFALGILIDTCVIIISLLIR